MAWIESHDNLSRHPKTRRAARMLGVSIPTMMGHLHLLWHWCLEYADDGDLSPYDADDIADAVMWEGEPDTLIDALLNCGPGDKAGFLEEGQHGLIVHDWMDYAGKLVAKREEARESGARGNHERWHTQRGVFDPDCPYCQETKPQHDRPLSGGESDPDRDLSHRTVPYLTIPNLTDRQDRAREESPLPPGDDQLGEAVSLSVDLPDPNDDMTFTDVTQRYHRRLGMLGPTIANKLAAWIEDNGMSPGVLVKAVDITADAKDEKRIRGHPDQYLEGVIRGMFNDGICTVEDLREFEGPQSDDEWVAAIMAQAAKAEGG